MISVKKTTVVERRSSEILSTQLTDDGPVYHALSYVDNTLRRSICNGEIFQVQSLEQRSRGKYPYFCSYLNFLKTQCKIGRRKLPCRKPAERIGSAVSTEQSQHRLVTDRRIQTDTGTDRGPTGVNPAGDAGDTSPPIFWLGDVNGNIPANIITYFWI